MVSGVAALLLSYHPDMSARELKYTILSNVDEISSLDGKVKTSGRLNAKKALEFVLRGNQVKNYKIQVNVSHSAPFTKSYVDVVYHPDLLKFIRCTPGKIFNESNAGNSYKSTSMAIRYEQYNPAYPVNASGEYCVMRFDTKYTFNCISNLTTLSYSFSNPNLTNSNVSANIIIYNSPCRRCG